MSEGNQLSPQWVDSPGERVDAGQRGVDVLPPYRRELGGGQAGRAGLGQQRRDRRDTMMKQLSVDALLPARRSSISAQYNRAIVRTSTTCPRGDPRLRQPALEQQRTQQPRIRLVGLRALLRPPQRRRLGQLRQMRTGPAADSSSTT